MMMRSVGSCLVVCNDQPATEGYPKGAVQAPHGCFEVSAIVSWLRRQKCDRDGSFS